MGVESVEQMEANKILVRVVLTVGWGATYATYKWLEFSILTGILLIFAFLLVSWGPSFPLELLERKIIKDEGENSKKDGAYIGWAERSLIFCAVWVMNVVEGVSIGNVFNFLSIIIAGKSIYRFPSRNDIEESKTLRQWYISGTFTSMTVGIFLSCLLIPEAPLFLYVFQ